MNEGSKWSSLLWVDINSTVCSAFCRLWTGPTVSFTAGLPVHQLTYRYQKRTVFWWPDRVFSLQYKGSTEEGALRPVMADIKNFLYAWCGKKKLTPNYDIRAAGNKNRQKFMCEVSVRPYWLQVRCFSMKLNSPLTWTLLPAGACRWLQLHRDGQLHQ